MKFPFYWVDAFSAKIFAGNPAGVVPLTTWPADAVMQNMAFEHRLAETAFFVRLGPARYHLRWFTPRIEIDLCGHATLASAHVIFNELGESSHLLTFESRSGLLTVARRDGLLELDFPARPAAPVEVAPDLVRALGGNPVVLAKTDRAWLCVYATADEVLALRPDHVALARLTPGRMIVTAPGRDCDFVSRFFAPEAAIPEDPVTGSAHCTLVPYWAERLGRTRLHARQVSARGGELWCELQGDRVKMAGHTALYLRGEISL